jgi:hypothetical protein
MGTYINTTDSISKFAVINTIFHESYILKTFLKLLCDMDNKNHEWNYKS